MRKHLTLVFFALWGLIACDLEKIDPSTQDPGMPIAAASEAFSTVTYSTYAYVGKFV